MKNTKTEFSHPLDWYRLDRPVSANFVVSNDGRYKDESCSSRGISTEIDLQHLIHLRRQCDALVTDGATARLEGYKPNVSRTTYVFTRSETSRRLIALRTDGDEDLGETFKLLRSSHQAILVETGPTLLKSFIALGLVDTLFLSVTGQPDGTESGLDYAKSLLGIISSPLRSTQVLDTHLNRFDFF